MKRFLTALALLAFSAGAASSQEDRAVSLGLVNAWTSGMPKEEICGCPYSTDWDGSNRVARIEECEFSPEDEMLTTEEVDFLPVIGASLAQRGFTPPEPRQGFPRKTDIVEDPAIYIPVLKDIISIVGERRYGTVRGGSSALGSCPLIIDYRTGIIEPTGNTSGVIGRILLYANKVWKLPLTPSEKALFAEWSTQHPATNEEKRRARTVSRMTGISNPIVGEAE